MRKLTLAAILAALSLTTAANADDLYKCSQDGKTTYQATPCSGGKVKQTEMKSVGPGSGKWVRDKETTAKIYSACKTGLVKFISFKDPDSTKIMNDESNLIAAEVWMNSKSFSGRALRMSLRINAKNSFGAYAGEKDYWCYTSTDGATVRGISAEFLME